MERIGWTVFRVHSRAFYRDPESALAHVLDYFAIDEVPEGGVEATVSVRESQIPYTVRSTEGTVEAAETAIGRERVDLTGIPLHEIQEALRSVAPEPGVEIQRDELFRRALPHVSLRRLSKRTRERLQSAMNGLIRRGEFGYRGRNIVWRLKEAQVTLFPDTSRANSH